MKLFYSTTPIQELKQAYKHNTLLSKRKLKKLQHLSSLLALNWQFHCLPVIIEMVSLNSNNLKYMQNTILMTSPYIECACEELMCVQGLYDCILTWLTLS